MKNDRSIDESYRDDERYCEERLGLKNVKGALARRLRELSPLLTPEELLGLPIEQGRFLVVDLETTGMKASECGIIEVGAVEVNGYFLGRELSSLVRPSTPVPPFIKRLTGIDDRMLAQAPDLDEVLPSLDNLLSGRVLVAHNLRFDRSFLSLAWKSLLGRPLEAPGLCTVLLSRRVFPELESHNLDSLAAHLRLRPEKEGSRARHRALGDAKLTARALIKLLRRVEMEGANTLGDVIAVQTRKKAGTKRLLPAS